MRVLLIGGAGYVGSHVAIAMVEAGHDILVLDDLSNSSATAVSRVSEITGREVPLIVADARDDDAVLRVLADHPPIDAIVLLAGLKSVAESVADPVRYYDVNLRIAVSTLKVAAALSIKTIAFSSSATVYGTPEKVPVDETSPTSLNLANPYGKTKRIIEEILSDAAAADPALRILSLRYFNPVGAHESALIGEDPRSAPTNLMPIVARVAAGASPFVRVFGTDYATPDGTGLRDYIDVTDLASGHVDAITHAREGHEIFNLGTGIPVSVLEMISEFERAAERSIEWRAEPRRPGDVAVSVADPSKAESRWGWRAEKSIAESCRSYWAWQSRNPDGYPLD